MWLFNTNIGQWICVVISLSLVTMNILDVITYRAARDSEHNYISLAKASKTSTALMAIVLWLFGLELAAWAVS